MAQTPPAGVNDEQTMRTKQRTAAGNVGLAEIARIAGVSEATVSRVMNRKYGVSAATRDLVEAAMREAGYARPVQGELVLLLTPTLVHPIFAMMCQAIATELAPQGLRSVICPTYMGTLQERDYVEAMIDAGIAAAVFVSSSNTLANADPLTQQLLTSRGIPFVSVNGGHAGEGSPVFSTDDWVAAELAVAHLYDLGHRQIGMCAGPVGNIPADRRVEGFVQAMDRRELNNSEDLLVRHHYSIEGGQLAGAELIAMGVTAIVASSDEMALGVIRAVRRAGLRVPEDISVVGYNDTPELDFTDPPLTSVRQPIERLGSNVARAIVSMISNRPVRIEEVLIEPEFRLRRSTGPVALPPVPAGSGPANGTTSPSGSGD